MISIRYNINSYYVITKIVHNRSYFSYIIIYIYYMYYFYYILCYIINEFCKMYPHHLVSYFSHINIILKLYYFSEEIINLTFVIWLCRRHFQMELEAHKSVRLIFNGHILQPDTRTLEQCGLFNDCVVHCWVHQPRPVSSSATSTLDNSSSIYFNSQHFSDLPTGAGINSMHEWDLSRLLVSIVTIMLGLAWYSRYHYAQLFTATTTLALYALTAIFTVSLFSNFFPDQDNIQNVE